MRLIPLTAEGAQSDVCADVARACKLIRFTYAIGLIAIVAIFIVALIRDFNLPALIIGWLLIVGGIALTVRLVEWVTTKLMLRRNWMRLVITLVWLAGVVIGLAYFVVSPKAYLGYYSTNLVQTLVSITQWLMSTVVVVYLNTSSARSWFSTGKRGVSGAA